MSERRRIASTLLLLAALPALALAQEAAALYELPLDGPAVGVYGGLHRGTIDAAFAVDAGGVTSDADCGRYEHGTTTGFVVGAHGELPLTQMFGAHAGVELAVRDAATSYPCVDPAGTRMPDGTVAAALTEFQAEADYQLLTIGLGVTIRPLTLPFIASVGPSLSILTAADYSAREVVVTPTEASFVSGGQERYVGAGDFGAGDLSLALGGSIWYEARLGGRWSLVPRLAGSIALTDEIGGAGIRGAGLEATLGIMYRFPPRSSVASPIEAGAEPAGR